MVSAQTRPQRPPRTALGDLADWLREQASDAEATGDLGTVVTGITLSSQRTFPGDLYAALPGQTAHGIAYAPDALAAGAVALLTDPAGAADAPTGVPLLVVAEPRQLLGRLAARVYGEPATAMRMVGVTGTQGKTTSTRLAEGGLERAGVRAGVIGTVGTRIAGEEVKTSLTTPEAPDLHALFALMREREVDTCAMEVSSHALVMGRVDGVVFDVAVFLNLGRDHLDFHADEEDYYRAKASLFTPERARLALVGIDDAYGRRLAGETTLPVRTFSTEGAEADWTVSDVRPGPDGTSFRLHGPGVDVGAGVPMPGGFNVTNALAAIAACAEAGSDAAAVAAGIAAGGGVPGRFERIDAGQPFTVVVDYAHKPDAVEAALQSLRPLTAGRLLVVLGAGGDRDLGKRPIMGEIAARLADVVVVTDDNPRTEDPAAIRAAVLEGARSGPAEVLEEGDRRAAIAVALRLARPGDIVVVAGKGHETGQEVAGVVHPFDDRDVVRELLSEYPTG
jgi:UDP-N-acetylmuramoyl-L-alanyl-D-glutamate--2,6-diaminopimelate ligase